MKEVLSMNDALQLTFSQLRATYVAICYREYIAQKESSRLKVNFIKVRIVNKWMIREWMIRFDLKLDIYIYFALFLIVMKVKKNVTS